jgi:hypothetical protein
MKLAQKPLSWHLPNRLILKDRNEWLGVAQKQMFVGMNLSWLLKDEPLRIQTRYFEQNCGKLQIGEIRERRA